MKKTDSKEQKQQDKKITLDRSIKIECKHNVAGGERNYNVSLVAREYTIVEDLEVEIDPLRNLIRRDKFEAIADKLTLKS